MGRGSSKVGGGNTFSSESDFENSLSGFDDPRLQEYSNAYSEEDSYTRTLKNNMEQSMKVDGYDEIRAAALRSELKDAQKTLDEMPGKKTPAQLGQAKAMEERIDVVKNLMDQNNKLSPGDTGTGDREESNIVEFKPRGSSQWDFRGEVAQTDKIIEASQNIRSQSGAERVKKAAAAQEKHLTKMIQENEAGNNDGDTKVLYTQRRRMRQLLNKMK